MAEARVMRRCQVCGVLFYPTMFRDFCGEYCHTMYMRAMQQHQYEMARRQHENSFRSRWEKLGNSAIQGTRRMKKIARFPKVRDMEV